MTATVPSWTDRAACRGNPGPFFGPDEESEHARKRRERRAKRICQSCPVVANCRALLDAKPTRHGVWAGESYDDRENRRRRDRRRELAATRRQAS